jgi:hypothetical protein
VGREEARNLVLKALEAETSFVRLPKFGLDYYTDPYFPGFHFFEATWDNPHQPPASVVLGHYAVNRRTADVWDVGLCKTLDPPVVRTRQKALRREMSLSEHEYRKLSPVAPCSAN